MNRESMAAQAEIAAATKGFVKELKRLRTQHGFGSVIIHLEDDIEGATAAIKVNLSMDLEFTGGGDFEDEWKEEKLPPIQEP